MQYYIPESGKDFTRYIVPHNRGQPREEGTTHPTAIGAFWHYTARQQPLAAPAGSDGATPKPT